MRNRKFQKNSKKIQKNKKYHYVFFSGQNRFEKDEKMRKQKLSFRIQCLIENSKKITKKFKKLRNTIMNSFLAKIDWKRMRKRGLKIMVSFCSYPKRN